MGRGLEPGKHPKLLTSQNTINTDSNKIVYLIVLYCADYDVIAVQFSMTTVDIKIKSSSVIYLESKIVQAGIHTHSIGDHYSAAESLRPALSPISYDYAVSFPGDNPWALNMCSTAVIYCHFPRDNLNKTS